MTLTDLQNLIRDRISAEVKSRGVSQIVYCTEWLGYLPFGVYHWIECSQQDFSRDFPSGWESTDLTALETGGFLEKIDDWQDPEDEYHHKTTFQVNLEDLK
jgi:hypothetical protein